MEETWLYAALALMTYLTKAYFMNKNIIAPLPGTIIEILVQPGDKVEAGQAVAVLEAMKMENELQAEYSGTVTAVNVAEGDRVLTGAEIVIIE